MEASEPTRSIAPAEAWWRDSFMVTFAFHCNIACTFCMVEDVLDVFEGTSLDQFATAARVPGALRGARRIIFSGGEVTLSDQLLDYVKLARSLPGIEHVRLQTNATRLSRLDRLDALIDAGVDEFFVSIHGHDEASCDALTQKKGSFRAIMAGIEAIASRGQTLITNTAIVGPNHRDLAAIVDLVAPLKPRSMEFWNYWPRGDEDGHRELAARVGDVRPHLIRALQACVDRGFPPVVKWFPRCLLGDLAWCQDDGQPPALIDDNYWSREPEYACLYEGVCADASPTCAGLSYPYIDRFGWEQTLLMPRRSRPIGTERGEVTRSLTKDAFVERGEAAMIASWLATIGIEPARSFAGFTMIDCTRTPDHNEVGVIFDAGDFKAEVRIRARDPSRACFARTASLDILALRPDPAHEARVLALLRAVAPRVAASDRGGVRLPQ